MAFHCVRVSRHGVVQSCPEKKACFHSSFCSPAVAAKVITFFFVVVFRKGLSVVKRKAEFYPSSICINVCTISI